VSDVVVDTDRGALRGTWRDGVARFLGVPYAAPPTGRRRFRPPEPERWAGVRDALALPPLSIQAPARAGPNSLAPLRGASPEVPMGEDCLALNLWTPDLSGRAPVMVWFHGGGYTTGSGTGASTDGEMLARTQGVVVVTVNHRLGLLGFLDLSGHLGPEYAWSGNASLLDLVAALEWVRDNISSFGGDPGLVTIFGCSGGGGKVAALMTMPLAQGLFHRAIIQSGPPFSFRDPDRARQVTQQVLDHLEVPPQALLEVAPERLYQAQVALGAGGGPSEGGMAFAPTVDGEVLADYPDAALARGMAGDVPLLIGTNRDEARFVLAVSPQVAASPPRDDAEVAWLVAPGFDGSAVPVVAAYRARYPELSSADLRLLIETEQFRVRSLRLADAKSRGGSASVFVYRMDWSSPGFPNWGAFHSLEVPLVFANTLAPAMASDPEACRLAAEMSEAWVAFAITGRPRAPGVTWDPYDLDRRATMIIDRTWRLELDPMGEERRLWEAEALSHRTRPWGRLLAVPPGQRG
jgi:para-nitrobenzyl esterase